jgi:antitoxin component of MazEF toxin-antitoxin module
MIDLEEFLLWSEFAFTHQAMLAGRKISLSVKQDSSVLMKPVQKQRRKSILANLKEDDEGIEEEEEEEGIEEGNEED